MEARNMSAAAKLVLQQPWQKNLSAMRRQLMPSVLDVIAWGVAHVPSFATTHAVVVVDTSTPEGRAFMNAAGLPPNLRSIANIAIAENAELIHAFGQQPELAVWVARPPRPGHINIYSIGAGSDGVKWGVLVSDTLLPSAVYRVPLLPPVLVT
jgi:hypothetical protein